MTYQNKWKNKYLDELTSHEKTQATLFKFKCAANGLLILLIIIIGACYFGVL